MVKFLHIADIHLGFDRYNSPERTKDFFYALQTTLDRHAIQREVDFVLIAGDLFEHRNIKPATLNQAQICLQALQQANIPVFAIEGNHDNRPYGTTTSWLKYLSEWGLLMLLEPQDPKHGDEFLVPWNPQTRSGSYYDLDCGVRVIGSNWYGSTAPRAIEQLAVAIEALPPGPDTTVLMFHHGLEGQIARYEGALRYTDLLPLKTAGVDYLALGHIHREYQAEGWVFNPGSLEANNVEESLHRRGAYLVEVTDAGLRAELQTDYFQRPILRLEVAATGDDSVDKVRAHCHEVVESAVKRLPADSVSPIVEVRITGQVGFDRLDLDTRSLQEELCLGSGALFVLLKYDAEAVAYQSPIMEGQNRLAIEQGIFMDMLVAHRDYKRQAEALALGLTDLKDRQLGGADEVSLYQFVGTLLSLDSPQGD
ncbi:DNA repair exonuclease [Leptolyngbya sp. BL0902]|uniref:metallophosphoesterase family protein n=1 Tax=Leptolyngbya sp. BL0902 TaxID=1115757 RepID=UPI0018E6F4EE|nr:DNA repair exonuclease [Leptolyngbya sp. BL0902]QQE66304.1 DNA repair exonuclease [Leptolyngbya sp. BL0902]